MRDKLSSKAMLAVIVSLVVAITGSAGLILATQSSESQPKPAATQQTPAKEAKKGTAASSSIKYQGEEGKTALELLKTHAEVATKDSSYGTYVHSINGLAGGTDNKYWMFYINGTLAEMGADAYTTKAGDAIEWKFE